MPSSLPTREEVVARIAAEWTPAQGPRDADEAAISSALAALYWVAVAEEARQAEAPKGETETAARYVREVDRVPEQIKAEVYAAHGERRQTRIWSLGDTEPTVGFVVRISDGSFGLRFDDNTEHSFAWSALVAALPPVAPPPVPVSTERPDGETGRVKSIDVQLRELLRSWPGYGQNSAPLSAGYGGFEIDDLAVHIAANLSTVPASLPPLTDEAIERAAKAAHGEWQRAYPGRRAWGELSLDEQARYREPIEAALEATGLYASPEEQA